MQGKGQNEFVWLLYLKLLQTIFHAHMIAVLQLSEKELVIDSLTAVETGFSFGICLIFFTDI